MVKSTVVLTGATGNTGANVLEKLIDANYIVNVILRALSLAPNYSSPRDIPKPYPGMALIQFKLYTRPIPTYARHSL
jgi:nucleoside-diphosphate-sugar epimerase